MIIVVLLRICVNDESGTRYKLSANQPSHRCAVDLNLMYIYTLLFCLIQKLIVVTHGMVF